LTLVRPGARALLKRYLFDVLIVLAAVGGTVEMVLVRGSEDGPEGPLWILIPAVLALTSPLLARRRFPFAAPALALLAAGAISFAEGRAIPYSFVTFLSVLTISFLFAFLNERREALAGLFIVYATGVVVTRNDPEGSFLGDFVFAAILFTAAWIAGFALNRRLAQARAAEERAVRLEREREDRARVAVAEERARIARELHDVVGHSVSVMTVQAGAVRRLLKPDQEREREALEAVEETGRQALTEMRRMVGVLRRVEEAPALAPQPGLQHVDRLVEQVREAGLPVALRIEGDPVQLPPGVDLTAYRVVQEALTNALKHSNATEADVLVRYRGSEVELVVMDDGRGVTSGDGGGHGLVGMRERVAVYGGDLVAGARAEGGYLLRARLPVEPT
jgi:signal transduction histidine kinase